MSTLLKNIRYRWQTSNKRMKRFYDLLHLILTKYRTFTKKNKEEKYKFFEQISPDHILQMIHYMNKKEAPLNPTIQHGFYPQAYLSFFLKLVNVKCLFIEMIDNKYYISPYNKVIIYENDEDRVHYKYKIISQVELEDMQSRDDYDAILILKWESREVARVPRYPEINQGILNIENNLTFNNISYSIDSTILTSNKTENSCRLAHAISGITCNDNRYVYNGWISRTMNAAMNDNDKYEDRTELPCQLMEYDWMKEDSDFCLNPYLCKLDKNIDGNDLCFNFKKGDCCQIYVRDSLSKAKISYKPSERKMLTRSGVNNVGETFVKDKVTYSAFELQCLRQRANWSILKPEHKFESANFIPELLKTSIHVISPKVSIIIQKINQLDEEDQKTHGKRFKHFIFSDLKSHGTKVISSALIASGFQLVYDKNLKIMSTKKLQETKGNNFALLSSSLVYGKPMSVNLKKQILKEFNERPNNIYGDNIRFIVMDSGFKEGIDLYDVKYVHVLEPQISRTDLRQVIGRATRTCGQKGLPFDPKQGWPLKVFIYDVSLPETIQDLLFPVNTLHELYLAKANMDLRKINMAQNIEDIAINLAFDKDLTENIHNHKSKTTGGSATMSMKKLQSQIAKKYGQYAWDNITMENLCIDNKENNNIVKFTPSQEFISKYFTPSTKEKGILLWHGVGVGKTCTAIAVASNSFEEKGYTILWVTRHTLKADIWKNMFDQVCHERVKQYLAQNNNKMPKELVKRKKLLSNAWNIEPLSYKQFSNLLQGKNEYYKKLVKLNGQEDPLKKTLLIIDEAHKLFNAGDLKEIERPDMDLFLRKIVKSYEVSGNDSVRLLLMSATPVSDDPLDFIKLINLLKEPKDAWNYNNFEDIAAQYLNPKGKFTTKGKTKFINFTKGYISYLDRSKDARQFAQPNIHNVLVPISKKRTSFATLNEMKKAYRVKLAEMKRHIDSLPQKIEQKSFKVNKKGEKVETIKKVPNPNVAYFKGELAAFRSLHKHEKMYLETDPSQEFNLYNKCNL